MASQNTVQINITANAAGVQQGVAQANSSLQGLNRSASSAFDTSGLESFKRGLGGIAAMAAAAGAALGGLAVAKLVSVEREFGNLSAQLNTATGSVDLAKEKFAELEGLAGRLPESLADTVGAFVKLKNLGLDPSAAAIESYSNTASALGKNLSDMIEAVADASTGEFERLKEFGIRASKSGDQVKLTFQGVTTTVKNNAVEIENYLKKIGDVNFAGAAAAKMQTMEGAISNLGDAWDGVFRKINGAGVGDLLGQGVRNVTDALVEAGDELAGAAADFTGWVSDNREELSAIWQQTKLLVSDLWDAAKAAASLFAAAEDTTDGFTILGGVIMTARLLVAGLQDGVTLLGAAFLKAGAVAFDALVTPLVKVQEAMAGVLGGAGKIANFYAQAAGAVGLDDLAGKWRGAASAATGYSARVGALAEQNRTMTGSLHSAADAVFKAFADGDTAVQRVLNPTEKLVKANDRAGKSASDAGGGMRRLGADTDAAGKSARAAADAFARLVEQLQAKTAAPNGLSEYARVDKLLATDKALQGLTASQKAYLLALATEADNYQKAGEWAKDYAASIEKRNALYVAAGQSNQAMLESARDEFEQYGLTKAQIFELVTAKKEQLLIDLETQQVMEGGNQELADRIKLLKDEITTRKQAQGYLDGVEGLKSADEAAKQLADEQKKNAEDIAGVYKGAFQSAEDALVDFVNGGKVSFKDLADSIVSDLIRIAIRRSLIQPLQGMFDGGGFSMSSLAGLFGGGTASATPGFFNSGYIPSAAGGYDIPSGVNPVTQLHEREMVLPAEHADVIRGLSRGAVTGGSNVEVVINNHSGQPVATQESNHGGNRRVEVVIGEAVAGEMRRPGSSTNKALTNGFGIRPPMIRR